jgi:hypothetical protein
MGDGSSHGYRDVLRGSACAARSRVHHMILRLEHIGRVSHCASLR